MTAQKLSEYGIFPIQIFRICVIWEKRARKKHNIEVISRNVTMNYTNSPKYLKQKSSARAIKTADKYMEP